ncbi:hypothetical protein T08_16237 [Trichinella sp. T8]|nr:hypothetical protein T08_16237 [Trichinella sp. T8]
MAYGNCNRLVQKIQEVTNVLKCICHGSVDDPKENATVLFTAFAFDAA